MPEDIKKAIIRDAATAATSRMTGVPTGFLARLTALFEPDDSIHEGLMLHEMSDFMVSIDRRVEQLEKSRFEDGLELDKLTEVASQLLTRETLQSFVETASDEKALIVREIAARQVDPTVGTRPQRRLLWKLAKRLADEEAAAILTLGPGEATVAPGGVLTRRPKRGQYTTSGTGRWEVDESVSGPSAFMLAATLKKMRGDAPPLVYGTDVQPQYKAQGVHVQFGLTEVGALVWQLVEEGRDASLKPNEPK
jgi:hypothetical protein